MKTKKENNLTYDRVNELIIYKKTTGQFFWALRNKTKDNEIKLKHDFITGHPHICIDGKYYLAKNIAYLLTLKIIPNCEIKLIDKQKYNLRWSNFIQIKKTTQKQRKAEKVLRSLSQEQIDFLFKRISNEEKK